ncbi:uncharacterized protein LOC134294860 [Anolis carolinensis]|uniref:uncharacterized protein LOC134294812 n=1 Tax=Anolis carolinensis TaxID=28377 RepID=UPI002F2B9014
MTRVRHRVDVKETYPLVVSAWRGRGEGAEGGAAGRSLSPRARVGREASRRRRGSRKAVRSGLFFSSPRVIWADGAALTLPEAIARGGGPRERSFNAPQLPGQVPEAFSPDVSPTSVAGILRGCEICRKREHIMRGAGLDKSKVGVKIAGRNINNLGYADDTTLMAESEEALRSLITKMPGSPLHISMGSNARISRRLTRGISHGRDSVLNMLVLWTLNVSLLLPHCTTG